MADYGRLPYRVPTDEGSGDTSFFHAYVEKIGILEIRAERVKLGYA